MNRRAGDSLRGELRFTIFGLLYMAAIFGVSSLPGRTIKKLWIVPVPDYVVHALAYAGLGAVWYVAMRRTFRAGKGWSAALAMLIVALTGMADEYYQGFTGRTSSVVDFAADLVGGFASILIAVFFLARSNRRLIS